MPSSACFAGDAFRSLTDPTANSCGAARAPQQKTPGLAEVNNKKLLESPKCASFGPLTGVTPSSSFTKNFRSTTSGACNSSSKDNSVKEKPVLVERSNNCDSSITSIATAPPALASEPKPAAAAALPSAHVMPSPRVGDPQQPPTPQDKKEEAGDGEFSAVSVALMASGLAWVRRQTRARYGTEQSRYPLDKALQDQRKQLQQQQQQERQQQQQQPPKGHHLLKKASSADSASARAAAASSSSNQLGVTASGTTTTLLPLSPPRQYSGGDGNSDELQIQSCPTSPFFVANPTSTESPVFTELAKHALASNSMVNTSPSWSSCPDTIATNNAATGVNTTAAVDDSVVLTTVSSQVAKQEEEDDDVICPPTPVQQQDTSSQEEAPSSTTPAAEAGAVPTNEVVEVELAPSLNPINTIYSLSSLLGVTPPTCSDTVDVIDNEVQHMDAIKDDGNSADDDDAQFKLDAECYVYGYNYGYYSNYHYNNHGYNHDAAAAAAAAVEPRIIPEEVHDYDGGIVPLGIFCQDEGVSSSTTNASESGSKYDLTKSPMRSAIDQILTRIGSTDCDDIDIQAFREAVENHDEADDDDSDSDANSICWIPPVRCVPELRYDIDRAHATNNYILNPKQMHQIARHVLPKGIAACQWKRLYSLARDGDSFDVCLHYVQNSPKTLLVVRTTRGAIFGGYAGEAWTKEGGGKGVEGRAQYYGNNETCLYTFEQTVAAKKKQATAEVPEGISTTASLAYRYTGDASLNLPSCTSIHNNITTSASKITTDDAVSPPSPPTLAQRIKKSLVDDDEDEDDYESSLPPIQVYKYKGVNRYIQLVDASRRRLAFGGGGDDGSFGLCLEQDFQMGSTGPCDTFDNTPLCEQENFNIVDVEIWGFLTGHF